MYARLKFGILTTNRKHKQIGGEFNSKNWKTEKVEGVETTKI